MKNFEASIQTDLITKANSCHNEKAIQYSTLEMESWIDNGLLPKDITPIARQSLDRIKNIESFYKKNPNPTPDDINEWHKAKLSNPETIENIKNEIVLFHYIFEHIQDLKAALQKGHDKDTFALPSHDIMQELLAMFVPRLIRVPKQNNSLADKIKIETKTDYIKDPPRKTFKGSLQIKNKAYAEIDMEYFQKDTTFTQEQWAISTTHALSPEGKRHFLGFIIDLEENMRNGQAKWSLNKHLDHLGYKRQSHGSYDYDVKKRACEYFKTFTRSRYTNIRTDGPVSYLKSSYLFMISDIEVKTNNKESITEKTLEKIEGIIDQETSKEILDKVFTLTANPSWYNEAFKSDGNKSQQYTKLLKKIVREDHRKHPLLFTLVPFLAVLWRINRGPLRLKYETIMTLLDYDFNSRYRSKQLKQFELELAYIKKQNYLGEWHSNNKENPYESTFTFIPPHWFLQELNKIEQKKDKILAEYSQPILSHAEFLKIFNDSGLTQKQFADLIGVTRQLITAIISGKRKISKKNSQKITLMATKSKDTRNKI